MMFVLGIVFLIVWFFGLWYVESKVLGYSKQKRQFGAKVTGPLMSISASGTIGKSLTYGAWKGIAWCREWFVPANPQSAEQTNMRYALQLALEYWQTPLAAPTVAAYNTGAEGLKMSGFNLYMKRALLAYIAQITVAVTPVSVVVANVYPNDVFTWT